MAALISEHVALQDALGDIPSVYALYRFAAELRRFQSILDKCLDGLVASVSAGLPDYGVDLAIDASDMPAFANGQRFLSHGGPERERFSDPDASWGHRSAISVRKGGGFYGYRIHAAVCARTGLPIAWRVETARAHESSLVDDLLGRVRERVQPETAALDRGYDVVPVYEACEPVSIVPSFPFARPSASSAATISRPSASMAPGSSREPTSSGRRRSGAAPGSILRGARVRETEARVRACPLAGSRA